MLVIFKKFFFIVLMGLTFFLTGCTTGRYHKTQSFDAPVTMVFVKPASWVIYPESKGVAVRLMTGRDVECCSSGKVVFVDNDLRGYGKTMIIQNSENFSTVYARLGKILFQEGDIVKRGQCIASAGQSASGKYSFYFELRKNSVAVDPVQYLQ